MEGAPGLLCPLFRTGDTDGTCGHERATTGQPAGGRLKERAPPLVEAAGKTRVSLRADDPGTLGHSGHKDPPGRFPTGLAALRLGANRSP